MSKIKAKCSKELYCQFLIAAQTNFTATACASLLIDIAHDAITRLLSKRKFTPAILWEYARLFVDGLGMIVIDDTVFDHPHCQPTNLVRWQYSGAHHGLAKGINLTSLLWSGQQEEHIPVNYRLYDPDSDGKTKITHALEMLQQINDRGIKPEFVVMDKFYAANSILHLVAHDLKWHFVCALRSNRIVYLDYGKEHRFPVSQVTIPSQGRIVHLKDFGSVKLFRFVTSHGKIETLATDHLNLTNSEAREAYVRRWKVEEYHRGLKQTTGVAECQARDPRSQRNHIFCCLLAFLALEKKRLAEGITWYEAKQRLIADVLFAYLKDPTISLPRAP